MIRERSPTRVDENQAGGLCVAEIVKKVLPKLFYHFQQGFLITTNINEYSTGDLKIRTPPLNKNTPSKFRGFDQKNKNC